MGVYLLGSKHLRVGLDSSSRVQEVHYPHLGTDNHTPGSMHHRMGVFVDGRLSWIDATDGWRTTRKTTPHALIPHTVAVSRSLGITIEFIDAVDDDNNTLLRNIHVVNMHTGSREVKLFMHQGFIFKGNTFETSAGSYVSESNAIVHHGSGVAFAVSLSQVNGGDFDQHTIGQFGTSEFLGTYMDALDGSLNRCDHETGTVDSTVGLTMQIAPMGSVRASYILSAGEKPSVALRQLAKIVKFDMATRIEEIASSWHVWLQPALQIIDRVEEPLQASFLTSLMSIRAHIDTSGAVMTHRPYGETIYSSPKIAGYILWPLIRLGYKKEAEQYFKFIRSALRGDVDVKSYYSAAGAEVASPFPYSTDIDGKNLKAHELDNAAMIVFMFTQLYSAHPSKKLIEEYYESLIVPLLDMLADQLDRSSGLLLPSYGLVSPDEPKQSTFTSSLVYAALLAGVDLAEVKRDAVRSVGWRSVADEIYRGVNTELIKTDHAEVLHYAGTQKSNQKQAHQDINDVMASYGLFMFGLLPSRDPILDATYRKFNDQNSKDGADDYSAPINSLSAYGRPEEDFPVITLWCAQYAAELDDEEKALGILRWVRDTYLEKYTKPVTDNPRSISELGYLWTQAEFVSTMLDLITETGEVK